MCPLTRPSLVRRMARFLTFSVSSHCLSRCWLIGAGADSLGAVADSLEPVLTHWELLLTHRSRCWLIVSWILKNLMKFQSKYNNFHRRKWIPKCQWQNGSHFVQASMYYCDIIVNPFHAKISLYNAICFFMDHSHWYNSSVYPLDCVCFTLTPEI